MRMLGTRMADHRFIIVDDHPLFRGALGQALSAAFANAEVLEAGSLDELTDRLAMAGEIDLILNTPLGRESHFDEESIRRTATSRGVPCITTLSGGAAAVEVTMPLDRSETAAR